MSLSGRSQEAVGEQGNVLAALAQRRHTNREGTEAVVEVVPEGAAGDLGGQVTVRGGDHAHVDLPRLPVAQRRHLALLEDAQQLRLHRHRHVADLVEEDGAPGGGLEESALVLRRTGEGAAAVTEELALEQRLGQCGTVDGDEGFAGAGARPVNAAGDQLLAGPGLSFHEHRDGRARRALHEPEDLRHGRTGADHVVEALAACEVAPERADLGPQPLGGRRNLSPQARVLDGDCDARGQRGEQLQVGLSERAAPAAVHDLDHPDRAVRRGERRGEQAARREPRVAVDVGIESPVGRHVVDANGLAAREHGTGDALVGREAQLAERFGHLGILLGDVGEVELVALGIQQEDHGLGQGARVGVENAGQDLPPGAKQEVGRACSAASHRHFLGCLAGETLLARDDAIGAG